LQDLESYIRDIPDFPKPGILFKDITPLLADPAAYARAIAGLAAQVERPDAVVAIESRGFLFGAPLALHWQVPLIPARKAGKLPSRTVRQVYALEYGEDSLEMHADGLSTGQRVVIVDDLLATGGTAQATAALARQLGADVQAALFLIELEGLGGRERLAPVPARSLLRARVSG